MDNNYIIKFENNRLGYGKVTLTFPAGCGILKGVTAVCGENGAGKTTFGTILEKGRYAFGNRLVFSPADLKVKMLAFTDIHSLSGMEVTYYNQRMEATSNDYVPTVEEIMIRRKAKDGWAQRCERLGLKDVAHKKINYLSSGELRKLLLSYALEQRPDLLILDNPYIGLDAPSRKEFDESIRKLREEGVSVVLLVSDPEEIPEFTDSLIEIKDKHISYPITDKDTIEAYRQSGKAENDEDELRFPDRSALYPEHEIAFAIRNGHIKYGDKQIFSDLNWEVKAGECWSLQGRNGSGKSLLLSMVCADNPQGYANDITLFDRKRGSGESIFEIKDNIGFVSPEIQLFFRSKDTVREIIVQGKRNSLNRYRPSSAEERNEAEEWMKLLGINHLSDRQFDTLSSGEQRLVLLARAFIKQPPLLILDEPFHGLDRKRKDRLKRIISSLVKRNNSSLIFVTHYQEEIPDCVTNSISLTPAK